MSGVRYLKLRFLAAGMILTTLIVQFAHAAESSASSQLPAKSIAAKNPPLKVGLVAFAKSRGFNVCAREIEALDQNLLLDSDYSLRAFLAETNVNTRPFSALVDSRKANPQGGYARALTNIMIAPAPAIGGRCTVMYEQTLYHDQHCDAVRAQMASLAPESGGTSFGSITFDVLRNMTFTIIPVGRAQCISVVKEVAY